MGEVLQFSQNHSHTRTPVAVFDYDGTCIDGQSGKLIATWLLRKGLLTPRTMGALTWWGIRYKLHLPQEQAHSHEYVFKSFTDMDAQQVDGILVQFHREVLLPRYRTHAIAEVRRRKDQGCTTVVASATFTTIAREAARYLQADGYVATHMERDAPNNYTGRVDGEVVAGDAKLAAAQAWANETLGVGSWQLAYAYGDHHSDIKLLESAQHPVAVCPGPTLKRYASKHGIPCANWKDA